MKTEVSTDTMRELRERLPQSQLFFVEVEVEGDEGEHDPPPEGLISVERRPHYCDRGTFVVKLAIRHLHIDAHDAFPRYYFHEECLVKELEAWMDARDLTPVEMNRYDVNTPSEDTQ